MTATEYDTVSAEYAGAFTSIRSAKNLYWLLVGLAILAQIAGFIAVEFLGVIDPVKGRQPSAKKQAAAQVAKQEAGEEPAKSPATQPSEPTDTVKIWRGTLGWVLPATKFLALAACMLLVITLVFAVKLSLLERMSGSAGLVSSFFWSIFLFAMLVPWQQVLQGSYARGALFNLGELLRAIGKVNPAWGAVEPTRNARSLYYARFLAYPGLALVVWLITQLKFARGYKRMDTSTALTPPPSP